MDPLTVVLGPWGPLGIAGSLVVGLGIIGWRLWEHIKKREEAHDAEIKALSAAHLADVKEYGDKYAEILVETSKTQTALANAIERIGDKLK